MEFPLSHRKFFPLREYQEAKMLVRDNETYAVFKNKASTEKAVHALLAKGFAGTEIDLFESHNHHFLDDRDATKLGEGLVLGNIVGGLLGTLWAFAVGVDFSFYVPPSLNLFASFLVCSTIGAMLGTPLGGIVGLLLPEYEVRKYTTSLQDGSVLVDVAVKDKERAQLANEIVELHGGNTSIMPVRASA